MDKIYMKNVWQDDYMIQVYISASSEYISVNQTCYIAKDKLQDKGRMILKYIDENLDKTLYIEFGKKKGNYTPAFSMDILHLDKLGHYNVEFDIEINDNTERKHRCIFFIKLDYIQVENLANGLILLGKNEIDEFNI